MWINFYINSGSHLHENSLKNKIYYFLEEKTLTDSINFQNTSQLIFHSIFHSLFKNPLIFKASAA